MRILQGKLQSIRQFIVQRANTCHPFNHLLHKGIIFKWDGRCDKAFQQVKEYPLTPSVLMPPIPNKKMIHYVSTTQAALGALLAQLDDNKKERVVYYIIQTLVGYELNYYPIEWACLSILFVTQKLRHYILNRQFKLISKVDPLKYLLAKVAIMGRIVKWVMILSEFDIEYIDRKAIKGHIIVDQLA